MKYIDLHCDTLMQAFLAQKEDIGIMEQGMADLKRLRAGGCMAQFFAIFMPPMAYRAKLGDALPGDDAYIQCLHNILHRTIQRYPAEIALARDGAHLQQNAREGKLSAFLTLEDGRAANGDLGKLDDFYALGVRLISLTWNEPNCFGAPNSPDPGQMALGLTPFGKAAIERMNQLGILVDVSHLSDGGFWDVAERSAKPFVASHSNCRALSPHPRNLTDGMIRALAEHGGVAGINFGPEFLHGDYTRKDSTVEALLAHIRHMTQMGGEGCVALGTDFDGIVGQFEVGGPDQMERLFDTLRKGGFTGQQIEKFAYGNAERVIQDVLV